MNDSEDADDSDDKLMMMMMTQWAKCLLHLCFTYSV